MDYMPRARMIKPGFFINDNLVQIEPLGRLLFAGLWCLADREGRLEDRPLKIKLQVLPGDNCDVDALLQQLTDRGFVVRYEVNGNKYIQVVNWKKHQNPHTNEVASIIPPAPSDITNIREDSALLPEDSGTTLVQTPEHSGTNPACILDPCILDPCIKSSSSEVAENATTDKPKFDETSDAYQLALLLRDKVFENFPTGVPGPTIRALQPWAGHIDKLIRLDKRSPDEIRRVIEWCQQHYFWYKNIRSPDKLRKQYGRLFLEMNEKGGARAGRTTGKPQQITPEHQARIDKYARKPKPDVSTGQV